MTHAHSPFPQEEDKKHQGQQHRWTASGRIPPLDQEAAPWNLLRLLHINRGPAVRALGFCDGARE